MKFKNYIKNIEQIDKLKIKFNENKEKRKLLDFFLWKDEIKGYLENTNSEKKLD